MALSDLYRMDYPLLLTISTRESIALQRLRNQPAPRDCMLLQVAETE
jgi:hypothetical protein